jgi:nicotinamidase-related amidase
MESEFSMWWRPDPDTLDAKTTALVIFDMLQGYRREVEASGNLGNAQRLLAACRDAGVIVCYARANHRLDGADYSRVLADTDRDFRRWTRERPQPTRPAHGADSPEFHVLPELAPQPQDFDIRKHRWNAFHGTALDLTLRVQNIDTVLIAGGSTHVGVASTVYAGRDLDYQMVVVSDACTGHEDQRTYFCDKVFPRMCRVRTVDQVQDMLRR